MVPPFGSLFQKRADVNIVEVREPTAEELSGLSSGCNCGCSTEEQADCGTKGGCC